MGDKERALEFFNSIRGRYIMAQALYYGVRELRAVEPEIMQEKSNIEDMEYLQECVFGEFPDVIFKPLAEEGIRNAESVEDATKKKTMP